MFLVPSPLMREGRVRVINYKWIPAFAGLTEMCVTQTLTLFRPFVIFKGFAQLGFFDLAGAG